MPEFRGHDLSHLNPVARFRLLAEDGAASDDTEHAVAGLSAESGRTLITLTVGGNDRCASGRRARTTWKRCSYRLLAARRPHPGAAARAVPRARDRAGQRVRPDRRQRPRAERARHVSAGLPMLAALNTAIADIAHRHETPLADVHRHFLGHGMRHADPSSRFYRPDDPSGWFVLDIEPNPRGSWEIRRLMWDAITS